MIGKKEEGIFYIRRIPETQPQPVQIPFEFEEHMLSVLGDVATDLPNQISDLGLRDAKKYFSRYLDILKMTFDVNVGASNRFLVDQIEDIVVISKSKIKEIPSTEALCLLMISVLGELNFRTLGGMLNNRPKGYKKTRIQKQDLELDRYYTICYSQTFHQKANLLCDYIQENESQLFESVKSKRAGIKDDEKFIIWMKGNYPEIYLRLF
nr:hypothetical protein [uncultured Oscillibacter sp.]